MRPTSVHAWRFRTLFLKMAMNTDQISAWRERGKKKKTLTSILKTFHAKKVNKNKKK